MHIRPCVDSDVSGLVDLTKTKAGGLDVVGTGPGGDPFHVAARALYESLGFTKVPIAGYLKKV